MFSITADHIRRLCRVNSFPVRESDDLIFFGLRGCLPVDVDDPAFGRERRLMLTAVDYTMPRCTLGQWRPAEGTIALFPGSTVPHRRYVQQALARGGAGANQMLTGYYDDYRKGRHQAGRPTGHDAFRQTRGRPHRRTVDDFDFENDDRIETHNPFDNLHAAWCMGTEHPRYASAGCQVVVGFPCCEQLDNRTDTGPWAHFRRNAYELDQDSFGYVLLDGRAAQAVSAAADGTHGARLRFGSAGTLVERVQEALKERGFYEGRIDGDFGPRTLRALLDFQTAAFGSDTDDGVVGPVTASGLGLDWPRL